jgi:transposase
MQTSSTYLGLDISKAALDLSATDHGPAARFANDQTGCRRLLKALKKMPGPAQIIAEATGGYERLVLSVLAQAQVPVTLVNPRRARDFARATGLLAKTDRLDAGALAEYGCRLEPAPTVPPSAQQQQLTALVTRRQQLVGLIKRMRLTGHV